jgi:GxxExxY protein
MTELSEDLNDLSYKIIGCAIEVHKILGPGLLESAYQKCLIFELEKAGLLVKKRSFFTNSLQGNRIRARV